MWERPFVAWDCRPSNSHRMAEANNRLRPILLFIFYGTCLESIFYLSHFCCRYTWNWIYLFLSTFNISQIMKLIVLFLKTRNVQTSTLLLFYKARHALVNLLQALVIHEKFDWQNFVVCGELLQCFCHSWQVNQISNMRKIKLHFNKKRYACVLLTKQHGNFAIRRLFLSRLWNI